MMGAPGCQYCEPRLRALLDDALAEAEARAVRDHVRDCPLCQATLAEVAQVMSLVGASPAEVEPPPHFEAGLQVRLAALRGRRRRLGLPRLSLGPAQPRWSRRYSLAGVMIAGTVMALVLGAPPRIGAQDLVGKVQASWARLQSYSCRFVAEGMVGGQPRRFEQQQWFRRPNLFRLETNEHYRETTFVEADRVTTYIPGADWQGKRIAIVRPRRAREEGLPFPFGAEWPAAYDITMDALVRALQAQQGGEMLGTEEVLGKTCYVLKFRTERPGGRLPKHYLVWVDQESFLPLKVKSYIDRGHQSVSVAVDLQTNGTVPSDTFHFAPPHGTFVVYGEVEPFVFTMPWDQPRTRAFETDPAGMARREMRRRARYLTFRPLAPAHLPPGYGLVRVRRAKRDGWLDAYWVNNQTGAVIKLLQQPSDRVPPLAVEDGEAARLRDGPAMWCRWREIHQPRSIQYVTWIQDGMRLGLAAAGVDRDEALRIAASVAAVEDADV